MGYFTSSLLVSMSLSTKAQQVLDLVKELPAVELGALVKALEEEFGVSAAAWMVVSGGGGGWAVEEAGQKDTVNVFMEDVGQQKIGVIKVVKELLNTGLKEAKELVEKAPTIIKENVKMEEAESLKVKLEEAGAKIVFK